MFLKQKQNKKNQIAYDDFSVRPLNIKSFYDGLICATW